MEDKRNLWDRIMNRSPKVETSKSITTPEVKLAVAVRNEYVGNTLFAYSFDGEKTMGEIGPIKDYRLNYPALRMRSWQMYLDSDVAQTVIGRYVSWVIGSGLKLQSEPVKLILESEGIELNTELFTKKLEARFNLYKKTKLGDFAGMTTVDDIAKQVKKNAIIGGDVLVIARLINGFVKIQLIDGCHVESPFFGSEEFPNRNADTGYEIKNGIEMDETGQHIAYWIKTKTFNYERIQARIKNSDLQCAFLVYGLKYRLNNVRGIPLISAVMETLKKMERYKEATLGSAEERQKIVYQIVHQAFSTGESVLLNEVAKAVNPDYKQEIPVDVNGDQMAQTVASTTNKQSYNMPVGAKMEALESKNELYFKDFYETNIDAVCATINIPPDVAKSKYDSNYSASRAAIKDWENTLLIEREDFGFQFYQNIYNFFLEVEIMTNKIDAPGYVVARAKKDPWIVEAYRKARWVGSNVPHIDPMQEVQAVRLKLGTNADSLPLMTMEEATEALGGGDSSIVLEQFATEMEHAKKLGVFSEPEVKEKEPPVKED